MPASKRKQSIHHSINPRRRAKERGGIRYFPLPFPFLPSPPPPSPTAYPVMTTSVDECGTSSPHLPPFMGQGCAWARKETQKLKEAISSGFTVQNPSYARTLQRATKLCSSTQIHHAHTHDIQTQIHAYKTHAHTLAEAIIFDLTE